MKTGEGGLEGTRDLAAPFSDGLIWRAELPACAVIRDLWDWVAREAVSADFNVQGEQTKWELQSAAAEERSESLASRCRAAMAA